MTEITNSNQDIPESQIAKPVRTLEALLELYKHGHRNFSGSDLRGVTVTGLDPEVKCIDLRGISLAGSNLNTIVFSKSISTFKVDLTGANLKNCNLRLANLTFCKLDQCDLNGADLSGSTLTSCSFRGSDFIKAIVHDTNFQHSDCTASDFREASFLRPTLSGTFTGANFTGANLSSLSLVGMFKQTNFSDCDLSSTSLSGEFSQANFCKSNLHLANLSCFNALDADFSDANLEVSEFSEGSNVRVLVPLSEI